MRTERISAEEKYDSPPGYIVNAAHSHQVELEESSCRLPQRRDNGHRQC